MMTTCTDAQIHDLAPSLVGRALRDQPKTAALRETVRKWFVETAELYGRDVGRYVLQTALPEYASSLRKRGIRSPIWALVKSLKSRHEVACPLARAFKDRATEILLACGQLEDPFGITEPVSRHDAREDERADERTLRAWALANPDRVVRWVDRVATELDGKVKIDPETGRRVEEDEALIRDAVGLGDEGDESDPVAVLVALVTILGATPSRWILDHPAALQSGTPTWRAGVRSALALIAQAEEGAAKATSSKASPKAKSQGQLWEAMVDDFPEGAREAFREFAAYRDDMKKPLIAASIKRLLKRPAPQLVAAFSEAIERGWQGPRFENWTAEGQPARARGAGTVDPFGHLDTLNDDDLPRVIDAEVVA